MNKVRICEYGCGNEAKYQLKNGKWCCSENYRFCQSVRNKNSEGLKRAYKDGKRNCEHLNGKRNWSKGKLLLNIEDVFILNSNFSTSLLKKYILYYELKENKCDICGIDRWNDKNINLECHHVDGNKYNNILNNLQLLCPNCHSQTENFRGKNINGNRDNYIDENVFVESLKNNKSIRKALIEIGLAPMGGNYERAKKIIVKYNLN